MKILYLCMGSLFKTFYDLNSEIKKNTKVDDYYFVTDPFFSEKFIELKKINQKKIIREYGFNDTTDYFDDFITKIREEIDNYYPINNAIFADRRLCEPSYAKFYISGKKFRVDLNIEKIINKSLQKLKKFFDTTKPNLVITHGVSTFGIHLVYAFCLKYKIQFINLRHTKVENFMTFDNSIEETYLSIQKEMSKKFSKSEISYAKKYINNTFKGKKYYSGHRFFNENAISLLIKSPYELILAVVREIKFIKKKGELKHIQSYEPVTNRMIIWYYENIRRPIKMITQKKIFVKKYSLTQNKSKFKTLFFPLHAEPEVSLSVYAKYYSDQLNFIRNLSLSLPTNYKIFVKDHPRNKGRRPDKFLINIQNIPNVNLVDYDYDSRELIDKSDVIIMLSGFVGFEALLRKKPVICFGNSLVSNISNYLPIFKITNFDNLHKKILEVSKKSHDFRNLEKFISAIKRQSEQIEIMSVLLRKKDRHGSVFSDTLYKKNIQNLKKLLFKFITMYN